MSLILFTFTLVLLNMSTFSLIIITTTFIITPLSNNKIKVCTSFTNLVEPL